MTEPIYDPQRFWELLERRVSYSGDKPMLIDESDRVLTFANVRDRALRVAAGFSNLGVGEGTPVTWVLPTRMETIIASLALSRLGAIQNPIIHIYREREIGFCLLQTSAEIVLVPGSWGGFDYTSMVEGLVKGFDEPPTVINAYHDLPEGDPTELPKELVASVGNEPIRWIYYTSGTTSEPKGVMHTDASLIAGGVGLARALGMDPEDVGSIAFPYAHIGGPDYLVCMLASGFPAVLVEKFDLTTVIETYRRHGVTMAGGSTAFYTMFLDAQRQKPDRPLVPTLRMLSGGGAPKPPELYYEVLSEMGLPVVHGYGMTESPMICQGSPNDNHDQLANTEGAPVDGVQLAVRRTDGSPCAPEEEGEVWVSGPQLFKGYKDPLLDSEAFDGNGWFYTGDLAVLHRDGHLSVTGRAKDVIIRKGENISAKEVEDVLYTHPKVAAVAVVGLPDEVRGERVCAVVETTEGLDPLELDEMLTACSEAGLMQQKIPEQLVIYDEPLPRNATLKVLKFRLRDELAGLPWP